MTELSLVSIFLVGLVGGVHCIGMCGGIVTAFSFAIPKGDPQLPYLFAYHIGRISSYTMAGFITGFLGQVFSSSMIFATSILKVISIVFLLLLASYISGIYKLLTRFEQVGQKLFIPLSKFGKKLIPFKSPIHTILYGAIWGWLPCGLVYSALTWSMASGDAIKGATMMMLFGLGTLPSLLFVNTGAAYITRILQSQKTRYLIAFLLFFLAILLLFDFLGGIK